MLYFESENALKFYNLEAWKCNGPTLEQAFNISKHYSSFDLIISMHGGGNIFSYTAEDWNRRRVLETFPEFEIVLFPQSIWPIANAEFMKSYQEVYSRHPRLTFLYRDRDSFNMGKQLFPKARPLLMPDMAFQIGPVNRFLRPTHDIMWLKRTDNETQKYRTPNNTKGYDIIVQDWWYWKTPKGSSKLEDSF